MTRLSIILTGLLLIVLLLGFSGPSTAGNPHGAYYGTESDRVFWFVQTSDTHITPETDAANRLSWLLTEARAVIQPIFFIVSGDLTDSTYGNWLGLPDGPHVEEWQEYRSTVTGAGMTSSDYFDIPGNHDAYNDRYFDYFLDYSIQGKATGNTQFSFTKAFDFGKYHFIGVNTAGNTGDPFSLLPPYGDPAGLDSDELAFIQQEMNDPTKSDSNLTLVFGHHPLFKTERSTDTYVGYGLPAFLSILSQSQTSLYGYGHTHLFDEAFFVPDPPVYDGFLYVNTASLGKSSSNQYTIMAIDCDGLSSKVNTMWQWPAVLITAPVDVELGGGNPYAYTVPAAASNRIRALVFDPNTPSVQFRLDGGPWHSMDRVSQNRPVWQGQWDALSLQGRHTLEVRASSASGTGADSIFINVGDVVQTEAVTEFTAFGKYVASGLKRTKVATFIPDPEFIYQGETVVFRTSVKAVNGPPIPGATVRLKISGPVQATITSTSADSNGNMEAVWVTSPPNKRTGGTPLGTYIATITDVAAGSQYFWDGQGASVEFTISRKR